MHACREHMLRALHAGHEHQEGMQLHSVQECCMWHTRTPVVCGSTVRMWGGWGLHSSMKFALWHACRVYEAHPMHAFSKIPPTLSQTLPFWGFCIRHGLSES